MFQEGIFTKNTLVFNTTNPKKEKNAKYTFSNVNSSVNTDKLKTFALILQELTGDKTQSITRTARYEYELIVK
ncbi:DUF1659 domain-containing protein [Lactobacillaceae bacterium Melli_B4]